MSLTKFTENTNVIAQLPDTPSLTSTQLKAKFDETGSNIKEYLNNTLTTEVDQLVATEKQSLQTEITNLSTSTTTAINEAIETENAMISDIYSTTKTYKVGDLCIYNNVLFRCITEILVGEAWNNEHWEQTTITDKIKNAEHYSTDEEIIGTWIDGKPIYRKCFNVGNITSDVEISTNITNFAELISATGRGKLENQYWATLPQINIQASGVYFAINLNNNGSKIQIKRSSNSFRSVVIILEYTKTTD